MENQVKMGIDAGGTLIKAVISENGSIRVKSFSTSRMTDAVDWIKAHYDHAEICATGGKANQLLQCLGLGGKQIVEFDATCRGVEYLCNEKPLLHVPYIITNVGTGTSIHLIEEHGHRRLGGTGVGGGTIMGLSFLMTGIQEFEKIVQLAKDGNRSSIDLTVAHVYEGAVPPIPGDLTASNFGRVQSSEQRPEDLLASVIGMVGETVSTASVLAADPYHVSTIVYIGSSFIQNPILRKVVADYTKLRGAEPLFVENGEYSGAMGALLSLEE
ncbi:type II pantothenate kinase [Marinicrinis lubricantis]|uniref:Type II pantothenate kinase n=1 Tax=Marinicrinis lubricantis TaxID=2086470 RepID=A0ABW1ITC9_9BACL